MGASEAIARGWSNLRRVVRSLSSGEGYAEYRVGARICWPPRIRNGGGMDAYGGGDGVVYE